MKITVTDFGAIKEATIEVGGLTVFVGQNGTGKSYLAKLIYGLQKNEDFLRINALNYIEHFKKNFFDTTVKTAENAFTYLQKLTPTSFWQAVPQLANLHAELFKNKLAYYFNDDCNLFVNTRITFSEIKPYTDEETQLIIDDAINDIKNWAVSFTEPLSNIPFTRILWGFCLLVFSKLGGASANYFPAARSNFMLTYKSLYRARADEHVGSEFIDFINNPAQTRKTGSLIRFDKPTEDFMSQLYDLDSSIESPLTPIANKLQSLLYGKDTFEVQQAEGALADFRYQINAADKKIRLHLTSSMVTEISPLLIGLKHWVAPNSLVIIDEPESHLHPEAQRTLVNGLVEAINQGLKIIFITHSPYILSCVNNIIKFSRLIQQFPDDADVQMLKDANPEMMALDKKITAYHFGLDGIVKDIVLPSGLIDEAEFTEPFDKINGIYEAMRDIEWEHRE